MTDRDSGDGETTFSLWMYDEPTSQGAEANRSGQYGEQQFEAAMRAFGLDIVKDDPGYHGVSLFPQPRPFVIRQPVLDFEGREKRADYLYVDEKKNIRVLIEIRSQLGGGTTDEKLLSTLEDLGKAQFADCWLVLFGTGFRGWVINEAYKKAKCLSNHNKRVKVTHALGDVLYRQVKHLVERGKLL